MAIRHLYTVLSDWLVMDAGGRATPVGIFHNIDVREVPAVKSPLGIVVALTADEGERFGLSIIGPDGQVVAALGEHVATTPPSLREHQQWAFTAAALLPALPLEAAGVYRFVVESEGDRIHEYPFGVLLKPPEDGAEDE